jgi:aminoglycoside phosphotransferase (APT) family kinase protein
VLRIVVDMELTAERVALGVERSLPDAVPVQPVAALRRGRSHASWMLDSGLGRLVAKVALTGHDQVVLDRLAEHHRVFEHGVPVPRLLAFDPDCHAVGGQLLIVYGYLPGRDADHASRSLPGTVMAEAMRAAGGAVAGLHQVPVGAFGDPVTGLGAGPGTWSAVIAGRVELLRRSYRSFAVQDGAIPAGLVLLGGLADDVSPLVRPAVSHLDLYLPNILLDDEGRFRALLDLEHVRRVDPVMDFVKPGMWMLAGRPDWAEAFEDGYREVAGWPERWPERLAVATGLELLTGVGYWAQVGDHQMRDDYLRRLRDWVRSDGSGHVWPSAVS